MNRRLNNPVSGSRIDWSRRVSRNRKLASESATWVATVVANRCCDSREASAPTFVCACSAFGNSRQRIPRVSPCPTMGTQRWVAFAGSFKCAHEIPWLASPLQCGCPRRRAQHSSGAKTASEEHDSPQVATDSSALREDLNAYNIPEVGAENSFLTDSATTVYASSVVAQHCSKSPISLSSVIWLVCKRSSSNNRWSGAACSSACSAART